MKVKGFLIESTVITEDETATVNIAVVDREADLVDEPDASILEVQIKDERLCVDTLFALTRDQAVAIGQAIDDIVFRYDKK